MVEEEGVAKAAMVTKTAVVAVVKAAMAAVVVAGVASRWRRWWPPRLKAGRLHGRGIRL